MNQVTATATRAVATSDEMHALGVALADRLRAGDLLVLSGGLGAGKTTLTRGVGEGLGVRGAVTSPTFVIARLHPPAADGPGLLHVDAYRLGSLDEIDDLDLDVDLAECVTVVEWGEGLVERLTEDRLEIRIDRSVGGGERVEDGADRDLPAETADEGVRVVELRGVGGRWRGVDLLPAR